MIAPPEDDRQRGEHIETSRTIVASLRSSDLIESLRDRLTHAAHCGPPSYRAQVEARHKNSPRSVASIENLRGRHAGSNGVHETERGVRVGASHDATVQEAVEDLACRLRKQPARVARGQV